MRKLLLIEAIIIAGVLLVSQQGHAGTCSKVCERVKHRELRHQRYVHAKERAGMSTALASWYYDAGNTACGTHYALGVANRTLPCGTAVRFCAARCATGIVQDRGPFIAGREFDLNPGLKTALGCGDLCVLKYRVIREQPKARAFTVGQARAKAQRSIGRDVVLGVSSGGTVGACWPIADGLVRCWVTEYDVTFGGIDGTTTHVLWTVPARGPITI